MIKLQAIPKPVELTDDVVRELTEKFNTTQADVWKQRYIIEALLKISFDKCCFCETSINEESKYMEVEHFHPKSLYPDEVVLWENLLPICKRCNGKKSDHDTKLEPIIHPVIDNPKEHITLDRNYRLLSLTEMGKLTISRKILYLNDSLRLVGIRFKIGEAIIEGLIDLLDMTENFCKNPSNDGKNKIVGKLEKIMLEGTKESEYSATAATVILTDPNYAEIKQLFIANNLWSDEFSELEQQVNYCALI